MWSIKQSDCCDLVARPTTPHPTGCSVHVTGTAPRVKHPTAMQRVRHQDCCARGVTPQPLRHNDRCTTMTAAQQELSHSHCTASHCFLFWPNLMKCDPLVVLSSNTLRVTFQRFGQKQNHCCKCNATATALRVQCNTTRHGVRHHHRPATDATLRPLRCKCDAAAAALQVPCHNCCTTGARRDSCAAGEGPRLLRWGCNAAVVVPWVQCHNCRRHRCHNMAIGSTEHLSVLGPAQICRVLQVTSRSSPYDYVQQDAAYEKG